MSKPKISKSKLALRSLVRRYDSSTANMSNTQHEFYCHRVLDTVKNDSPRIIIGLINQFDLPLYQVIDYLIDKGYYDTIKAILNICTEDVIKQMLNPPNTNIDPLMLALDQQKYNIALLLIEYGASVNAKRDIAGEYPVLIFSDERTFEFLLVNKANITVINSDGDTVLGHALYNCYSTKSISIILDHVKRYSAMSIDQYINTINIYGETAYIRACMGNNVNGIKYLHKLGYRQAINAELIDDIKRSNNRCSKELVELVSMNI